MERIYVKDVAAVKELELYLRTFDLKLDAADELYVLKEGHEIIASGCISGKILKCIAVKKNENNLINTVMTFLINKAYELGHHELFIYTKPESSHSFEYFGFKKIISTENVVLMENKIHGIDHYTNSLKKLKTDGLVGSVVVNCNPFTLGHRHLIEFAASKCDHLHVFVVWEDESTFPNEVRYKLIEEGIKDLHHITMHKGGDYIITNATFPSYFLKDDLQKTVEHATLDLNLFSKKIAPALNIKLRFVGEEPFNQTTALYNDVMKQVLPRSDIEVVEIKRKKFDSLAISASTVRELIYRTDDSLINIVPKSTYDYLKSDEAKPVIESLKLHYNKYDLV